jgi:hypothetical protein
VPYHGNGGFFGRNQGINRRGARWAKPRRLTHTRHRGFIHIAIRFSSLMNHVPRDGFAVSSSKRNGTPKAPLRTVRLRGARLQSLLAYRRRRKSIMAALTSGALSCWVQ